MLNSIKVFKRYCKTTFNVFFNDRNMMMTIKFIFKLYFLYQIKILLLNKQELLENPGFLKILFRVSGFSRFFQKFLYSLVFRFFP